MSKLNKSNLCIPLVFIYLAVGSGLSTTAKVAIGLVVGIIALLIAITVATILAAWAFSGRRSTKASNESSADIPAMKYTTLEED